MTQAPPPWFPIITERLELRDFRNADLDDIHDYAADPEVSRYENWGPNTLDKTREVLAASLTNQTDFPRLYFNLAMQHRVSGRLIGSISIGLRDAANRTAEIGYCLRRDHWRQGYSHEAARALIDVTFGALDLHRVFATCDVRNTGSWAVMQKLGMRREGEFHHDRKIKGAWRDSYLYAVLRDEWSSPVA